MPSHGYIQTSLLTIQGCRQGGGGAGGAEAPPDFNSCYFTAKNVEKQERKNSFQVISMQFYIQKIEAQKCPNQYEFYSHYMQQTHWLHCTQADCQFCSCGHAVSYTSSVELAVLLYVAKSSTCATH